MLKQKQESTSYPSYSSKELADYPSSLSFYTKPPSTQITLQQFETMALDRLQVLLALDSARIRSKTDADLYKLLEPVLEDRLPLSKNGRDPVVLSKERIKDTYSHHILRLAYSRSVELRSWFLRQEVGLFKVRWATASNEERDICIRDANLGLDAVSLSDVVKVLKERDSLASTTNLTGDDLQKKYLGILKAVYGDGAMGGGAFYRVPFENVLDLVGMRKVLVFGGFAYVAEAERVSLVVSAFQEYLRAQLEYTSKALPRMDEDDRLMPILSSVAKQSLSKEYRSSSTDDISADDIPNLLVHFPLCMQTLNNTLVRDSHLKHTGRIQYGLFLKGIGLSLDESLIFWRKSFSKLSDDEFNKKGYPYNIRYNYGMEGKRTDYTPYSCVKLITSVPGPNETHGCPFRSFGESLGNMITEMGVGMSDVNLITKKAKDGHYQLACTKLYEVTKGKMHEAAEVGGFGQDADGNFMLLEPIEHPNKYFDLSYGVSKTMNSAAKNLDVE